MYGFAFSFLNVVLLLAVLSGLAYLGRKAYRAYKGK